jgi:hypothetical protein
MSFINGRHPLTTVVRAVKVAIKVAIINLITTKKIQRKADARDVER